ncbi:MAG: Asp-tRNA(Asn)/Glu-tRNA(Gln) amidotransferase subunit GatA [Candidatus Zixiibacteriota bacterium]
MVSALELQRRIVAGEIDLDEYYRALLAECESVQARFNCLTAVTTNLAQATVDRLKTKIANNGPKGKLFGLPIVVKDNICLREYPTACGSKILRDFVPPYNATVIDRLIAADAVIIAKANMDEFAMGSSNENSAFGAVKNPHDPTRVPGGSSGGSAVAVSSGLTQMALGSDTGGSVRQPAAHCGVVGLKPTYGAVSRYGLVAYASSLDQIGPLTSDVRSAALLFDVISGKDERDSTSVEFAKPDFDAEMSKGVSGLRVGVPQEYFAEGLDTEIRLAIDEVMEKLKSAGAQMQLISLPHTKYAIATYYIIADAEASSNLARYDGVKYGLRSENADLISMYTNTRHEGFGAEVKRRIMLGTYVLSAGYYDAYYQKAMRVRRILTQEFAEAFKEVDVLLTPTTPTTAFKIGEKSDNPIEMYLSDIYTVSANLAGLPAISAPCGKDSKNLPIGLQLTARHFDEAMLFRVAMAVEDFTR